MRSLANAFAVSFPTGNAALMALTKIGLADVEMGLMVGGPPK